MPNLNISGDNFARLIPNKLLKLSPSSVEKYYFLAQLSNVEYL